MLTSPTRPPQPDGPDEDPRLPAAMCKCGTVWLTPWAWGFLTEGAEHTRDWCRRMEAA